MPPFYTYISAGGAPPFNFENAIGPLDGVNDYIAISNYPITATSWSIGMWFYPTTGTGTYNYLFGFTTTQAAGVYINTNTNILGFLRNNSALVNTSIVIPLNEWNFIGWTKNGDVKEFHVYNSNGYSFATMTNTDFATNLVSIGALGATFHFAPYRFDETAVWNNLVLTKTDFDLMWNGGAGADLNTVLATQPNLHYSFNQSSGTIVPNDGATAGFNGTINNSPTPIWGAH